MRAGSHTWVHNYPANEMIAPAGVFEMTLEDWFNRAGKQRAAFIREQRDFTISQELLPCSLPST